MIPNITATKNDLSCKKIGFSLNIRNPSINRYIGIMKLITLPNDIEYINCTILPNFPIDDVDKSPIRINAPNVTTITPNISAVFLLFNFMFFPLV